MGDDGILIKLRADGSVEWQRSYGGSANDAFWDVKQLSDGGLVIAGSSASSNGDLTGNNGSDDAWVLRTDYKGDLIWQRNFGGTAFDYFREVVITHEEDIILAGQSLSNDGDVGSNYGGIDIWAMRLDNDGNEVWRTTYGGSDQDELLGLSFASDGTVLMAGQSISNDNDVIDNYGGYDYWIYRINGAGNIIWQQNFGGSSADFGRNFLMTSNGDLMITGSTTSSNLDVSGNYGAADNWIVYLEAPPLPEVQLPADRITCAGDSVEIAPSITNCLDCTIQWQDDFAADSLRTVAPTIDFTYEVIITDTYGCTARDDMNFTVNPIPLVDLGGDQIYCVGEEPVTLNAGNPGATYLWNTNDVTQLYTINTPVTNGYAVTVTDGNACTARDSVTITFNELPTVDLGNDTTFCEGSSLTLDAGNFGANFQWSVAGETGPSIVVNSPDVYSVTVTDAGNCSASDEITVQITPFPTSAILIGRYRTTLLWNRNRYYPRECCEWYRIPIV